MPFNDRKKPKSDNQVIIYGKHPVLMAIKSCQRKIYKIYVNRKFQNFIYNFLQSNNLNSLTPRLQIVDSKKIDSLFVGKVVHQGFVVMASRKKRFSLNEFLDRKFEKDLPRLLILDQLTDSHNIGAIMRTAAAFNVRNIIVTKYNFPQENSTIIKTSAGMIEFVDFIEVINLNKTIKKLQEVGYFIVGLDGEAEKELSAIKKKNVAIVLGSEGKGIRPLVKKSCDTLAKIPMSGNVESLNASVAGAIGIYEVWGR